MNPSFTPVEGGASSKSSHSILYLISLLQETIVIFMTLLTFSDWEGIDQQTVNRSFKDPVKNGWSAL
jgi:hypothetical protein